MPEVSISIGADPSKFLKGIERVQAALEGISARVEKYSADFKRWGLALTGAATAGAIAIGKAVDSFADFERAVIDAAAVTGAMGKEFEEVRDELAKLAIELSIKTKFAASELAKGMYALASAGWSARDMTEGYIGICRLAAATQSDLARTTELVVSTLTSFGMETKESTRVADVFAKIISMSQANMEKLAYSMRYAAPIAHSLGISLEEVNAVLSLFYDLGYRGEMAGTAFRAMMSRLIEPTKEAVDTLHEMNLTLEDVSPSANSVAEILGRLADAQMTENQALRIFGEVAGPVVMGLINLQREGRGVEEVLKEITSALEDAGGTAERIADVQLEALAERMSLLKSSIEAVCIILAKELSPALGKAADSTRELVDRLAELPEPLKKIIAWGAVVGTAITGMAGATFLFIGYLPAFTKGLKTLTGLLKGAVGPATLIGKTFVLVGGTITALVAATKMHIEHLQKMGARTREATEEAKRMLDIELKLQRCLLELRDAVERYGLDHVKTQEKMTEAARIFLEAQKENIKEAKEGGRYFEKLNQILGETHKTLEDLGTITLDFSKVTKTARGDLGEFSEAGREAEKTERGLASGIEKLKGVVGVNIHYYEAWIQLVKDLIERKIRLNEEVDKFNLRLALSARYLKDVPEDWTRVTEALDDTMYSLELIMAPLGVLPGHFRLVSEETLEMLELFGRIPVVGGLLAKIGGIAGGIPGMIAGLVVQQIPKAIETVSTLIRTAFVGPKRTETIRFVGLAIPKAFDTISRLFVEPITEVARIYEGEITKYKKVLGFRILVGVEKVYRDVEKFVGVLPTSFAKATPELVKIFEGIWKGLTAQAPEIRKEFEAYGQAATTTLIELFRELKPELVYEGLLQGKGIMEAIRQFIEGGGEAVQDFIRKYEAALKEAFGLAAEQAEEEVEVRPPLMEIRRIFAGITEWMQVKAEQLLAFGAIPSYQAGGIVGRTGLAYLHKGEVVIPAGFRTEFPINVIITTTYDARKLGEDIAQGARMFAPQYDTLMRRYR